MIPFINQCLLDIAHLQLKRQILILKLLDPVLELLDFDLGDDATVACVHIRTLAKLCLKQLYLFTVLELLFPSLEQTLLKVQSLFLFFE
jgi:hypothetical protein